MSASAVHHLSVMYLSKNLASAYVVRFNCRAFYLMYTLHFRDIYPHLIFESGKEGEWEINAETAEDVQCSMLLFVSVVCCLCFLGSPIWKPRVEDQESNSGNVVSAAVESLQSASKGY